MPLSTLEEIRDVLQHRRKHCRDLLELSRRQIQFIESNDFTQLMATLAQKQRILGRLDEVKRRYPPPARSRLSGSQRQPELCRYHAGAQSSLLEYEPLNASHAGTALTQSA